MSGFGYVNREGSLELELERAARRRLECAEGCGCRGTFRELEEEPPRCEWFALCEEPAAGRVAHPAFPAGVPCCKRCALRLGLELERAEL